ncbi:peptidylprolyl isomerase [Pseudomonadota bacterium]
MKKKVLIGLSGVIAGFVVLVGIYSLAGGSSDKEIKVEGEGRVIATSEFGKVYASNIQEYLFKIEKMTGNKVDINSLQKEELEFIAKDIIIQKKLAKEARKSPITRKVEVKEKVKSVTDSILKTEYLTYLAEQNVTDDAVRGKYDSLKQSMEGKKEYKIKHILVETKEEAREATRMLYQKSFEDVAREVSLDTGTAQRGGDLGYLVLDSLDKDFAEKVRRQEIGKISAPFKTQFGWHIIIVENSREAVPAPYEDIKENLKQQMKSQYVNDYIKSMFDDIKVELQNKEPEQKDSIKEKAEKKNEISKEKNAIKEDKTIEKK